MSDEGSPLASAYTPAEAEREDRFFVRASNFAKIVFVFVVLGPPIGWFILFIPFLISSLFVSAESSSSTSQFIPAHVFMLIAGILFSYLMGGLPALLVGFVVAFSQMAFRSFGIIHAAGIGLAVAFLIAYDWIPSWPRTTRNWELVNSLPAFNFTSVLTVVMTIICWAIVSRWLRKVEQVPTC